MEGLSATASDNSMGIFYDLTDFIIKSRFSCIIILPLTILLAYVILFKSKLEILSYLK